MYRFSLFSSNLRGLSLMVKPKHTNSKLYFSHTCCNSRSWGPLFHSANVLLWLKFVAGQICSDEILSVFFSKIVLFYFEVSANRYLFLFLFSFIFNLLLRFMFPTYSLEILITTTSDEQSFGVCLKTMQHMPIK